MNVFAVARRGFRKLAVCCVIAALCLGLCLTAPVSAADPPAVKGLEQALVAQVLHEGNLLSQRGVAGVAISADKNGRAVLLVMTERAGVAGIPNKVQGVAVRVMVTGKIMALKPGNGKGGPPGSNGGSSTKVDPTGYFQRPVPIGVSIGTDTTSYCFAGTVGCRLLGSNGTYYALSNNHVFAEQNAGTIGTDHIIQPGTYDTGCILDPSTAVGTLAGYVHINFDGSDNYVDAAVATLMKDANGDMDVGFATPNSAGYTAPASAIATAYFNQPVEKYGRTTGDTKGVVNAVNATVNVSYDAGVAVFVNQIIIVGTGKGKGAKFSDAGDSGSLIVEQNSYSPVGLLFAGSSGGPNSITIANPIDAVLSELGSKLDGGITLTVDDGP